MPFPFPLLLDLSSAFDTVDHDILVQVLDKKFGVKDYALQLFVKYLRLRCITVCVNGTYSSKKEISFSIPQGLINGPVLFNSYSSTIWSVIDESIKVMHMSIWLTKNIRTPKGFQIIRRVEKAPLNERIRSINNTINIMKIQRDTCIDHLERVLNEDWMDRCRVFIEIGREAQHYKTLERQKDKFNRLLQRNKMREGGHTYLHSIHIGNHSNTTSYNNTNHLHDEAKEYTWVKNL